MENILGKGCFLKLKSFQSTRIFSDYDFLKVKIVTDEFLMLHAQVDSIGSRAFKSVEYFSSNMLFCYKNPILNLAQAFATILVQNVFEIDFNMNLSFSFTSIQSTQVKMQKNHINFILSCRIVITELSIPHVIYDDMNNFLWRLSLTNGCNLKCIFMHTHFSTLLLAFVVLTLHNNAEFYILYFSE